MTFEINQKANILGDLTITMAMLEIIKIYLEQETANKRATIERKPVLETIQALVESMEGSLETIQNLRLALQEKDQYLNDIYKDVIEIIKKIE